MQPRDHKNSKARLRRLRHAMRDNERDSVLRKVKWFAKRDNIAYLNYAPDHGRSILQWAVEEEYDDIALILLSKPGVLLEHFNSYSTHIIINSVDRPTNTLFTAIINHPNFDAISEKDLCTAFFKAVSLNRTDLLATALTKPRFKINMCDADGRSPLMLAASEPNVDDETFKFIISQPGVDVNAKDKQDRTALFHAVMKDKPKAVATLLECHGIDIAATVHGSPALVLACNGNKLGIVAEFQAKHMTSGVFIVNWALNNKHDGILQVELTQPYITPYALDAYNKPYLQMAIEANRPDVVMALVSKPEFDMFFASHYKWLATSNNPEIWALFLNHELLANDEAKLVFHAELFKAALTAQNFGLMRVLIQGGMVDVNTIVDGKTRAIDLCARNPQYIDILKLLLAVRGINAKAMPGMDSPLMIAASFQNTQAVEWLLPDSDVNYTSLEKNCALHWAMAAQNTAIAMMLLKLPETRIDLVNNNNRTPLMTALDKGFIAGANLILDNRNVENLELKDVSNRTAFYMAVVNGALDVMEKIYKINPAVIDIPAAVTPFALAVYKLSDMKVMLRLLEMGANPTALAEDGNTPLRHAMVRGLFAVALEIVKKQTDKFEHKDATGKTDLMLACELNCEDIVVAILKKNISCVGLYDNTGNTALMYAVRTGNARLVEILLTADSRNINLKDDAGDTALTMACTKFNDPQLTKLLLRFGANPELANGKGHNAQHIAIQKQHMMAYHELTNHVNLKAKEAKKKSNYDPLLFSSMMVGSDAEYKGVSNLCK